MEQASSLRRVAGRYFALKIVDLKEVQRSLGCLVQDEDPTDTFLESCSDTLDECGQVETDLFLFIIEASEAELQLCCYSHFYLSQEEVLWVLGFSLEEYSNKLGRSPLFGIPPALFRYPCLLTSIEEVLFESHSKVSPMCPNFQHFSVLT